MNELLRLFDNGIDKNRGDGRLYTAPLEGAGESGSGIGASQAYSNGSFILVSNMPQITDVNQIQSILVNDGIIDEYPELIQLLENKFPQLKIAKFSDVANVAVELTKNNGNGQGTENNITPTNNETKENTTSLFLLQPLLCSLLCNLFLFSQVRLTFLCILCLHLPFSLRLLPFLLRLLRVLVFALPLILIAFPFLHRLLSPCLVHLVFLLRSVS